MSTPPRIVVVGSINADLQFMSPVVPRGGQTILGSAFDMGFGGKGANQAVAASLCGAQVTMVAAVGADSLGAEALTNLQAQGVDTSAVRVTPDAATGTALILVEPSGENRIIVVKGANDRLSPADIDAVAGQIAAADMVLVQFEIPLQTVYHTVRLAQAHHVPCMINPAPALAADLTALACGDYLILNETEAQTMTGRVNGGSTDLEACLDDLLASGMRRVVLTVGAKGAMLASRTLRERIPGFQVATVDTTGAGDAFMGSLATFLTEGMPEREAVTRANLYAALSATRIGAQKSFARRAELDAEWARRP